MRRMLNRVKLWWCAGFSTLKGRIIFMILIFSWNRRELWPRKFRRHFRILIRWVIWKRLKWRNNIVQLHKSINNIKISLQKLMTLSWQIHSKIIIRKNHSSNNNGKSRSNRIFIFRISPICSSQHTTNHNTIKNPSSKNLLSFFNTDKITKNVDSMTTTKSNSKTQRKSSNEWTNMET